MTIGFKQRLLNLFKRNASPAISKNAKLVIYTTGLNEENGLKADQKAAFIQKVMNQILSQTQDRYASIEIVNYDAGWQQKTQERLTDRVMPKHPDVSIRYVHGFLEKTNINTQSPYLILNFAGNEIRDSRLLNDLHFINTSLYVSKEQENSFIDNIQLNNKNEMPMIYDLASNGTWRGIDRSKQSIANVEGELQASIEPAEDSTIRFRR